MQTALFFQGVVKIVEKRDKQPKLDKVTKQPSGGYWPAKLVCAFEGGQLSFPCDDATMLAAQTGQYAQIRAALRLFNGNPEPGLIESCQLLDAPGQAPAMRRAA